MNPNDFTVTYTALTTLLEVEASALPPMNVAELEARYQRRATVSRHLSILEDVLYHLRGRIDDLPRLPHLKQVRWVRALLAFPNLAFLEVDTDGLYEDADILRLVLVDRSSTPLYTQLYKPRRPIDRHTTHLTAITAEMVEHAPSLAEEWERITNAFSTPQKFLPGDQQ